MELTATILLFLGVVFGFMAFTHLSMNMKVPKMTWMIHLVAVALGLTALIIYAFVTESQEKHYNLMVIFGLALIPALMMFVQKSMAVKKALALVYGFIGLFGFFWLLTYVLP
ncbi:hypothetical protein GCM10007103_03340 [Salinimicrobium marinum]|uniref:Uncharacterized protein n=1 Tax=Salinimicrobium marinum TaxID=680283 RepID=A0A918VU16_9FLAO|nr:hypothetical protein [Salinimicrobium marinum]GHA25436.1 hypothetical protein GCM10007103_03340 [Salinimicrobium marinum]